MRVCHPCEGAMPIFSASLRFRRMIPEGNPLRDRWFQEHVSIGMNKNKRLTKNWPQPLMKPNAEVSRAPDISSPEVFSGAEGQLLGSA